VRRSGELPQIFPARDLGSAAFLWPTVLVREREPRIETKQARIGDARIESDSFGKGESKKGPTRIRREGLRKLSSLTAPGSRDWTRRLKREQRARESHRADSIRTRVILQCASTSVRPIYHDRSREHATSTPAPHPATGRGGRSGNKSARIEGVAIRPSGHGSSKSDGRRLPEVMIKGRSSHG
jgi:hypothetical protein